ncbi:MAG: RES family NAD+ phosphorylase [Actinomycetota bacterium]|nr:RES family NAD+ phosphorylase [Actinomycetota bacterium]
MLYRAFAFAPGAALSAPGGALFVARAAQGAGRHDNPGHYGALYASRSAVSAVAEVLQQFRNQVLAEEDLSRAGGRRLALATINEQLDEVVDLDDPEVLLERALRPSAVATRERRVTQRIAFDAFEGGATGLSWWSTLEASWVNVTLFAERAGSLAFALEPEPLSLHHAAVRRAADELGIALAGNRAR